jgi:hypothetical protein
MQQQDPARLDLATRWGPGLVRIPVSHRATDEFQSHMKRYSLCRVALCVS